MTNTTRFLVSTKATQGQRDNDFSFVPNGDIVHEIHPKCSDGWADDNCGCHRALVGIECHAGTTTFRVTEGDADAVVASLRGAYHGEGVLNNKSVKRLSLEEAARTDEALRNFAIGDVVELREHGYVRRTRKVVS